MTEDDPTMGEIADAQEWPFITVRTAAGQSVQRVPPSLFDDPPVLGAVVRELYKHTFDG